MTRTDYNQVGKILVVADELQLKDALVDALSASYEVRGYTSARQALEELRREEFDSLASDLMMPEMDGIALDRAALEIDPHLVVIIIKCSRRDASKTPRFRSIGVEARLDA